DQRAVGVCLNNLGKVAQRQGKYQQAIDFYQQSMKIRQAIGDRYGVCILHSNLAQSHLSLKAYAVAESEYRACLAIAEKIGSRSMQAKAISGLGQVQFNQRQYAAGISTFKQALEMNLYMNALDDADEASGYLALSYLAIGEHETALKIIVDQFTLSNSGKGGKSGAFIYFAVALFLVANSEKETWTSTTSDLVAEITDISRLELSPDTYFETALAATIEQDKRLTITMAYEKYLTSVGKAETAHSTTYSSTR
ncbi:MAG: tetratricopeptide repeat protein, partial [Chloroflexota bacterium]